MVQIICKYHPQRPARWSCLNCQIYYCSSCITDTNKARGITPTCPICEQSLQTVSAENVIEPFWNRLHNFFLYPLKFSPMILIIILSASSIVVGNLPWFAVLVVMFFSVLFFMKYTYMVLEHTAKGYLDEPPESMGSVTSELILPLKQILIIVATYAVNFTIFDIVGASALMLILVFTIVAAPASVMVLATEHSFFKAFNPVFIGNVITRIGLPYFILCIFLMLLLVSARISFGLFAEYVPSSFIWPCFSFFMMYFVLIMFNMMGYVIFQFHEKLGYEIEADIEAHHINYDSTNDSQKSDDLKQAEILLKEGKSQDALDKLVQAIRKSPIDYSARDLYNKLLAITGNTQQLIQHTTEYIHRLMLNKQLAEAIKVLRDTRHTVATYIPPNANIRYELATFLYSGHNSELALALLNNLHKDHPDFVDIPQAYYLAAQIMCEKFGDDKKAISVLDFVLNHYPNHKIEQQVKNYKQMVQNLSNNS